MSKQSSHFRTTKKKHFIFNTLFTGITETSTTNSEQIKCIKDANTCLRQETNETLINKFRNNVSSTSSNTHPWSEKGYWIKLALNLISAQQFLTCSKPTKLNYSDVLCPEWQNSLKPLRTMSTSSIVSFSA